MWRLYVTVQSYQCRMQSYQCRKNELVLALQIFKATQVRICFIATLVHAKFLQQNCLSDDLILNGRILTVAIFHESYIIPIVKKIQLIYFSFRNKFCGSRKVGYGFFYIKSVKSIQRYLSNKKNNELQKVRILQSSQK